MPSFSAQIRGLAALVVQRQVAPGIEMLVGVTTDPTLGPLLVGGFGGTHVELDKDVAFRVTPVTDRDAEELVESLRARARLAGFRGAPGGDRAAFIDVLRRIAALVEVVPELVELDCNPVILAVEGATVVDARVLLAPVRR